MLYIVGLFVKPSSRICDACDAENIGFQNRCIQCNNKLDKKKFGKGQSKKAKEREKRKKIREQCNVNKRSYKTRREANLAAKAMFEKGQGLKSYWCKGCNGYHLTKQKG